jgi:hypothetical protein
MKKAMFAFVAFVSLFAIACNKENETATDATETQSGSAPATASTESAPQYDFVIDVPQRCRPWKLTINDCGDASYKDWLSTANCNIENKFNGLVVGSGNPLMPGVAPTFPTLGVTYHIFDNSTTATRDVLSVTFRTGYNMTHKPTISYNPTTRKFTIVNAGNSTYISVFKFSHTGLIQSGVIEFC